MGIGAPFTVVSTATRHMLDTNVTFGMSSDRFNSRDKYRRDYTGGQRVGAGIGTALGTALPAVALAAWVKKGMRVPGVSNGQGAVVAAGIEKAGVRGLSPTVMRNAGRVAGVAALGLATAAGTKKMIQITQDDGHLGAVGAATGVVAGTFAGLKVGQKFAGRYAPLVSGAGAIIGGIAGYQGAKHVKVGEGHIGEENVQAPQHDMNAGNRITSFARGGINHFNEVGPVSTGVSFGSAWGMRDAVQNKYSNSERAGAMHGDLLAAGILGGGALAVAGALAGVTSQAGVTPLKNGANIAGHVLSRGPVTGMIQKLGEKGALGVGAAGVGIAGVIAAKEYSQALDASGGNHANAAMWAGGTVAATAATAALVSRSAAFEGMAAAPKAAGSVLVGAALIGVLSSARLPLQQFLNDAKDAHKANGSVDKPVAAVAAGTGAIAGGLGAFKGLSKMIPDSGLQLGKFHVAKGLVVGAGTAISAAAVGGIGFGLSATMPDIKKVGLSVGAGAAAGAAVGLAARGVGLKAGIAGGAALGLTASALLKDDAPKPIEAGIA
ncbi:MAG: hypothetical protein JWM98_2091 [Thermoleophilia bacterium]|nr:hypothetical protein [Thermoleophilia bacterium]